MTDTFQQPTHSGVTVSATNQAFFHFISTNSKAQTLVKRNITTIAVLRIVSSKSVTSSPSVCDVNFSVVDLMTLSLIHHPVFDVIL